MKKRRMAIVTVAVLAALAGMAQAVFAQTDQGQGAGPGQMKGPGQMRKMGAANRLGRLTTQLNLTEAQQAQIKPMLEDEEKQLKALRGDATLSPLQKRDKAREVRQATFEKIKPILTPEQQKKHDAMREKARERVEKRRAQ